MASQGMFGLNVFAFVLVLFLLVEFNSSEEYDRNERSIRLKRSAVDGGKHRSFFPIDGFEEPGHPQESTILQDPEALSRIRRSPGRKPNRIGTLPSGHTRHVPPKTQDITGFPNLKNATPKGSRKRWTDSRTGEIFEWDSEKGEMEKYNKRGKHLGSFDPYTGAQRGEAKSNRSIEP